MKEAVILIGHGGIPRDFSPEKVTRLKTLESLRQRTGSLMSEEEKILDHEIRNFPRTPQNDPFYFGTQAIFESLASRLPDKKIVMAFNEFCAPSIEQAVDDLVLEDFQKITLITTMFTRGGVHAEFEIPEIIKCLKLKYPNMKIIYAWPFDLELITDFLEKQCFKNSSYTNP